MKRSSEPGWTQIGAMCNAGRRSVWVRETWTRSPDGDHNRKTSIELCSGREGDDWHATITADDPAFRVVHEITSMLLWIVEMNADADERDEARLPSHLPPDPKVKGAAPNDAIFRWTNVKR